MACVLCACSDDEPYVQPDDPEEEEDVEDEKISLPETGLPTVVITTPSKVAITSKDDWTLNATIKIYDKDGVEQYSDTTAIKGRGNTTWDYPKKPYALKLNNKASILGMKKHKRWCLLANWMDRTLLRDAVAFEIGQKCTALDWTPHGEFCELILNGEHLGNYYLCEAIKIDKNRVNLKSGGYIMEMDVYYDEQYKFHSAKLSLPYQFKDPDVVDNTQFNYMKNYVNEFEETLYDNAKFAAREFTKYIDLPSFVDWWFVQELTNCEESQHPKSAYVNKDTLGLMKAGPIWDYDWDTFTPNTSYTCKTHMYYPQLFKDAEFVALVKSRWETLRPEFEKIPDFIDEKAKEIATSDIINNRMWPVTYNVNGDGNMTFDEAISRMKSCYNTRLQWLDNKITNEL